MFPFAASRFVRCAFLVWEKRNGRGGGGGWLREFGQRKVNTLEFDIWSKYGGFPVPRQLRQWTNQILPSNVSTRQTIPLILPSNYIFHELPLNFYIFYRLMGENVNADMDNNNICKM